MFLRPILALVAVGLLIGFCACDDDNISPSDAPPSLEIRLTDDPGDYEKVIIDLVDVQVNFDGSNWINLEEDYAGSYDLLELTAGRDTLIATGALTEGQLQEVRLILGDQNFVQIDGELLPLRTPSAQQSGLKIKLDDAELVAGNGYVLELDFDAGRSVVRAGNSGNFNLKPVIRASFREVDLPPGAIIGSLSPAEGQYLLAYQATGDTLGTYADSLGVFQFSSVAAGTYTVEVMAPDSATYDIELIPGVQVNFGQTTDLGLIDLEN